MMPRSKPAATERRETAKRAADLAPRISVEHEPVPKSVSRVLNAGQVRREHRNKKRQRLGGVGVSDEDNVCKNRVIERGETTALKIKPGETISHFNRRVEGRMMPLVKAALQRSSAQLRRARREEVAQGTRKRRKHGDNARHQESLEDGSDPPPTAREETLNPRNATKEFLAVSTSAPRRLNDVAREPPMIKKLPRGATKNDGVASGVLSMAQKAMMEEERDKAIRHYRELKARRLRASEGGTVKPVG